VLLSGEPLGRIVVVAGSSALDRGRGSHRHLQTASKATIDDANTYQSGLCCCCQKEIGGEVQGLELRVQFGNGRV
jgi:hypothetical protein